MKVRAVGCKTAVVLLKVTVLIGVCTACSSPPIEPIETRANDENVYVAILGNVTLTTAARFNRFFRAQVYGAEVSVECVYKKTSQNNVYEKTTVIGFGATHDCTNTEVELNKQYIFLLSPYEDGYSVVEPNVQSGAEPATEENVQRMRAEFGCDEPSWPTTAPPTTTPIITTRPPAPTTEAPTTEAPTVPVTTEPMSEDVTSDGLALSSSCLAALTAVVIVLQTLMH